MKFAVEVFKEISDERSTEDEWFTLHNLSKFFKKLVSKALNQTKWEWKKLWLDEWERDALVLQMIQCFIVGCDPAFIPSDSDYTTNLDVCARVAY